MTEEGVILDDRRPKIDPETWEIMRNPATGEVLYMTAEEAKALYAPEKPQDAQSVA